MTSDPTNSEINNAACHVSAKWLLVAAFPYIYPLSKFYPHTHTQILVQCINCALLFKDCLVSSRFFELGSSLMTPYYFCNVLTDVTSADIKNQQEAQIEHFLQGWGWGGLFFSHVTPCLACSQSSEEQMYEHIYKAGLWWADTHEACSVPILLHRHAVLKQSEAPLCINLGQTMGPHKRSKSRCEFSVVLIPI